MKSIPIGKNYTCSDPLPTGPPPPPTYGDGSQTCLAYTLYLNATPTDALHATTLDQMKTQILADGNHPTTGIIATKWLPEALGRAGLSESVLDIILEPTAPSWMDQIAHGATTVRCTFNHGFCCVRASNIMVPQRYGAHFRQKVTLEDPIGSHACSREALPCV
jgi:hypothetical protein